MSCRLKIFITLAVMEATQFSDVTTEVDGEVIVTTGGLTLVLGTGVGRAVVFVSDRLLLTFPRPMVVPSEA